MLDDVEHEDHLHVGEVAGQGITVEVGEMELVESTLGDGGPELVDTDHAAAAGVQGGAEVARAAPEIEHGGAGGHLRERLGVRAAEGELGVVVLVVRLERLDVEVAAVDEAEVLQPRDR